jgi:hypothetical protein
VLLGITNRAVTSGNLGNIPKVYGRNGRFPNRSGGRSASKMKAVLLLD